MELLIQTRMKQLKLLINVNQNLNIEQEYLNAIQFVKLHYENFPVLSFLLPKKLYKHVAIIYKFARMADDIADEGNLSINEREMQLDDYEKAFNDSLINKFENDFWMTLSNTILTHNLSPHNFTKLLTAFRQDITKTRYSTIDELLNYCENSANPVGRIILELYGIKNDDAFYFSDKICIALQITNFLQDVSLDFNKGRVYLPIEELNKFNVDENTFHLKEINSNFQKLMSYQVEYVSKYFDEGKKLLPFLPFRLKQQIKWTINGGQGILKKIINIDYNVLNFRPKFSKFELFKLLF